jgi:hypothetical protein
MVEATGRRKHIVKVTLNDHELQVIRGKAIKSGLPIASLLRLLGMGASVTYS